MLHRSFEDVAPSTDRIRDRSALDIATRASAGHRPRLRSSSDLPTVKRCCNIVLGAATAAARYRCYHRLPKNYRSPAPLAPNPETPGGALQFSDMSDLLFPDME